ncbi:Zinc finger protein [Fasciola hepatica]|uniref:Zinc finger protein n=1 Tax=Fasciola hepatica TaxID=6192 RepID=A0A4E0QYP7_FASHE|nr:Zinc finger protein [Fasciola hepatica]
MCLIHEALSGGEDMAGPKNVHHCGMCSASFDRASRLEAHQRIHTGERPYQCDCGKKYTRAQHLKRHQLSCSPNKTNLQGDTAANEASPLKEKKIYTCTQCNAGPFRQKKMVWAHIAMVHRERKHVCAQCSRAFPTKSKLDSHSKKHHGFVCTICYPVDLDACVMPTDSLTWKFENFIDLRRHMAMVHPKPGLRCPTCNQRFNRPKALEEHELTHTPGGPEIRRRFVCPLCPKLDPTKLEESDAAPSVWTPQTTEIALSHPQSTGGGVVAFTVKRNLHAHMRTVHANYMFQCTWQGCPVMLSTKQKLMQHMERHKTGKPVAFRTRGPRNRLRSDSPSQQSVKPGRSVQDHCDPSSDADSEGTVVALLRERDSDIDSPVDAEGISGGMMSGPYATVFPRHGIN